MKKIKISLIIACLLITEYAYSEENEVIDLESGFGVYDLEDDLRD